MASPIAAATPGGSAGSSSGSIGSLAVVTGSASSGAHEQPPYIADAKWVAGTATTGPGLLVVPTGAGLTSWGPTDEAVAWAELLALAPDADTPGMRQQFACHWVFARVAEPERRAWSLEPWRPVVPDWAMIVSRCNPESGSSSSS